MQRKRSLGIALLVASILTPLAISVEPATPPGHIDVLFSPEGGCEARVIAELAKARRTIRLQAYAFTNPLISKALTEAKGRGVDCEVLLDKSNRTDKYSIAKDVHSAGVACLFDDNHTVANNKVILIDATTVITGSFNFTKAAEVSNAENLLVITGMPEVSRSYADNYAKHRQHARPYGQPPTTAASPAPSDLPTTNDPKPTTVVYVTTNGKKYHRQGCDFLHGTGRPMNRSDIQGKYEPCSRCKP